MPNSTSQTDNCKCRCNFYTHFFSRTKSHLAPLSKAALTTTGTCACQRGYQIIRTPADCGHRCRRPSDIATSTSCEGPDAGTVRSPDYGTDQITQRPGFAFTTIGPVI